MRIAFVSPYPPLRDGIADYTASLARELGDRGHEVRVLTPRPSEAVAGDLGSRPLELLREWPADVVHVQFAVAAFGSRLPRLLRFLHAARELPARVVVTMHEVSRDTASLGPVGRGLYRLLAGLADEVVVHTRPALDLLQGDVGAPDVPARVIPLPVPEPPAADTRPVELRERWSLDGRRVLLSFGFIHVDKGLDDLVRALAALEGHDDVQLVVAGEVRRRVGPFRTFELRDRLHERSVRRLIRRLGLSDRITFTGYVPAGEVIPWFELAEAAVLPYRRIEQSAVAHLAAAAGCPVAASDAGGLAAELRTPWSFPAGDVDGLSRALSRLLDAGAAGTDRAPATAGGASLELAAERTLDLYDELGAARAA